MTIAMNRAYTYEGNGNGNGNGRFSSTAPVSFDNPASFQREFGDACCPRTIYVGNLDPRVDANQLTQIFSPFGLPTHILIKPALAGISNGRLTHYAFVKFATEDQAKSALHANNLCVFERPMWVLSLSTTSNISAVAMRKPRPRTFWARDKDYEASRWDGPHVKVAPVVHKSAKNLYVCNLPLDMEKEELERVFSKFGKVLHCVVLAMVDAYQRKRGFVDMETHEAAELAIGKSDGMEIRGAKLMVGYALVQRSGGPMLNDDGSDYQRYRARPKGNKPRDRPFDSRFESRFDSQTRFEYRSDVVYPMPLHPSEVYADDTYNLQDRMNALRMVPFDGLYGYAPSTSQTMNQAAVNQVFQPMPIATPRPPSPPVSDPCNLFVKNICPEAVAEDVDLQRVFAVYGTIVSGKIMRWPNGQAKGFGFVSFRNADEAAVARRELDGTVLGTKRIFVSYAERKAERRRRLASIYGSKDAWLAVNGGADLAGGLVQNGLVVNGLLPNGVSNGLEAIPEEPEMYGEGYPEGAVYYPIEPSWSYPTALGYNQGYPHGYEFCNCPECPSVGIGVGEEVYQIPETRVSSRTTYNKTKSSDKENAGKEAGANVSAEVGTEKSRVVEPVKRAALREGSGAAATTGLLQMR